MSRRKREENQIYSEVNIKQQKKRAQQEQKTGRKRIIQEVILRAAAKDEKIPRILVLPLKARKVNGK